MGSFNEKTITANDTIPNLIQNGLLSQVTGILYDEHNIPKICKGGYIIVDKGYLKVAWLINPTLASVQQDRNFLSEWLESVRKDIV